MNRIVCVRYLDHVGEDEGAEEGDGHNAAPHAVIDISGRNFAQLYDASLNISYFSHFYRRVRRRRATRRHRRTFMQLIAPAFISEVIATWLNAILLNCLDTANLDETSKNSWRTP